MKRSFISFLMFAVIGCVSQNFTEMNKMVANIQLNLENTAELYDKAIEERKEGKDVLSIKKKYETEILKARERVLDGIDRFNSYCDSTKVSEEIYKEYLTHINTKAVSVKASELESLGVIIDFGE